jgi:hypothetical protein
MKNLIRLEHLPNELLMDIFKYIDARMLYQNFYNLNSRLNILLESLTQLWLVLYPLKTNDYDELFASRIHTLIVHSDVHFTLSRYVNVRRLILYDSKHDQISQIMLEGFYLETISLISPRCFYSTFNFHEMIFSNQFPYLKSSYLTTVYSPSFEVRQLSWSQSPSIRSLCISSHDSLIHLAILNACPNLYSLHLILYQLDHTPTNIKFHRNLKQLKLVLNSLIWPSDETIFQTFFSLIPCLERLIIERTILLPDDLLHFDWLAKIITQELLLLKQFRFYLHLLNSNQYNQTLCQIETNFRNYFSNNKSYYLYINMQ